LWAQSILLICGSLFNTPDSILALKL
jgi:hypothetical protein